MLPFKIIWASSSKVIKDENPVASAGNRTRAARVAGEHSTTEPPMLAENGLQNNAAAYLVP